MCETVRKGLRESPPALAQPLTEKFAHSGHMRRQLINGSQPDIKTGEARRKEGMPLSSMPQVDRWSAAQLSIKAKTELYL